MKRTMAIMLGMFVLTACADPKPDYATASYCRGLGFKEGSKEFSDCTTEQRNKKLMEQQRRDYERTKQEDMDWKLRRY